MQARIGAKHFRGCAWTRWSDESTYYNMELSWKHVHRLEIVKFLMYKPPSGLPPSSPPPHTRHHNVTRRTSTHHPQWDFATYSRPFRYGQHDRPYLPVPRRRQPEGTIPGDALNLTCLRPTMIPHSGSQPKKQKMPGLSRMSVPGNSSASQATLKSASRSSEPTPRRAGKFALERKVPIFSGTVELSTSDYLCLLTIKIAASLSTTPP